MAIKRNTAKTQTLNISLFIKDPDAGASTYFASARRVGGASSVTLPDQAPQTNTVNLLDENVEVAGRAGAQTITVPLGALNQSPEHRLLAQKARDGENVQVTYYRMAETILTASAAATVAAAKLNEIAVVTASQSAVKNSVLNGHIVAAADSPAGFVDLGATGAALTAPKYRLVGTVEDDGSKIIVATPYTAAVGSSGSEVKLTVLNPGFIYRDVTMKVQQMASGDAQPSSLVAGNLVLQPLEPLPVPGVLIATVESLGTIPTA